MAFYWWRMQIYACLMWYMRCSVIKRFQTSKHPSSNIDCLIPQVHVCLSKSKGLLCRCSIHCRRPKVESTPSIRSCVKTSASPNRGRRRSPRWEWTYLIPTTPHSTLRLPRRTSTVDRQCLVTLDGDAGLDNASVTPMRITNIMDIESSLRLSYCETMSVCGRL